MNKTKHFFSVPFFLFLLPLFFVVHAFVQNSPAITPAQLIALAGEYLLWSGGLFAAGLLFFRRWYKAAIFSFSLLFLQLFFGAVHDGLKDISPHFFGAKYSVLLPVIVVLIFLLVLYIRQLRTVPLRSFTYLNLIFLLLLLIDLPSVINRPTGKTGSGLPACRTCPKPDVYLIIADEYADSVSLAEALQFNNGDFQAALRNRGFHIVPRSKGNYNFTPFAVASLLGMNYLPGLAGSNSSRHDLNICEATINHNPLLSFFAENGYAIKNLSIFSLAGEPAPVKQKYLLLGKELVRSKTFTGKLERDLGFHLVTTLHLQSEIERYTNHTRNGNEKLLSMLRAETRVTSEQPRFIYTHLLMPHYPYYYDKKGGLRPLAFFTPGYEKNTSAYVEYLQYSNGVYLALIDSILTNSAQPPVIIFMGDHGFREYKPGEAPADKYFFMNLNSVYLPSKDYHLFTEGLSGVNQFRVVLNSVFGQHLPMLKDSTSLLRE